MCTQCGCGMNSVGSTSGMVSVNMMDVSNGQMEIAEESSQHEMAEGMVDPD
jgi:hypothetical protein